MSSTLHLVIPKHLLLPEIPDFRVELGYQVEYYQFLSKVVCVMRDAFSDASLYRGETYEEYVIMFLADLQAVEGSSYSLCNRYLGEVLSCAMQLNNLLPTGVFEQLEPLKVELDWVTFIGVVHAVDYR